MNQLALSDLLELEVLDNPYVTLCNKRLFKFRALSLKTDLKFTGRKGRTIFILPSDEKRIVPIVSADSHELHIVTVIDGDQLLTVARGIVPILGLEYRDKVFFLRNPGVNGTSIFNYKGERLMVFYRNNKEDYEIPY